MKKNVFEILAIILIATIISILSVIFVAKVLVPVVMSGRPLYWALFSGIPSVCLSAIYFTIRVYPFWKTSLLMGGHFILTFASLAGMFLFVSSFGTVLGIIVWVGISILLGILALRSKTYWNFCMPSQF